MRQPRLPAGSPGATGRTAACWSAWVCPECLAAAPIHDHRERQWRHLDTCQYRTLVHARVPRLSCPTHGIRQVRVPWAEEKSRFTALFEALAIDWLKQAAIAPVADR